MEDIYEEIIIIKDKPLFKEKISIENHQIFYKYTSHQYYKYIYDLLDSLCKKSPYESKSSIFHMSLYFILKILYKCKNDPYLTNLDLIVLNCFSLGVKSVIKQKDFPSISRIKKIYEEKYNNYKNEEIYEGEIICLKLLNYNINILTAFDCIIYLTKNDLKLKELSLINLDYIMANNLMKFIYKSPFDIAKECIKNIQDKIIVKGPKIIKKKIISPHGFNCSPSPLVKKYSSTDRLINLVNSSPNIIKQMSNDEIRIKRINNLNKSKNSFAKSKKSCLLISSLNLKDSADRIYYKKSCNDIHVCSSTSLVTESNLNNNNNISKKHLFYTKINKISSNRCLYNNNRKYNLDKKKSIDISRKKIYLNNNKIKNKRNQYGFIENNLYMNSTLYFKRKNNYNNSSENKENDNYYMNVNNIRNNSDINNFNSSNNSPKNQDSFFDSFLKGIKHGIETKSINLGSLTKCINNNSNDQKYNISLKKNEHQKIYSSNYFNNSNCSHEGYNTNKSIGSYYIRW